MSRDFVVSTELYSEPTLVHILCEKLFFFFISDSMKISSTRFSSSFLTEGGQINNKLTETRLVNFCDTSFFFVIVTCFSVFAIKKSVHERKFDFDASDEWTWMVAFDLA